jgi:hypothetical protein
MKIEMGKTYKTCSGLKVRLLCTDDNESIFCVVGVYYSFNPVGILMRWKLDGQAYSNDRDLDLVEVPPYAEWPIDAKIRVRVAGGPWVQAHFAGVRSSDERPMSWTKGRTSWTVRDAMDRQGWDEAELVGASYQSALTT